MLQLKTQRFRQFIWIRGESAWCHQQALLLIKSQQSLQTTSLKGCWVQAVVDSSTQPPLPDGVAFLPASKARQWLGSEQQVLVIDTFSGFNPDALGALAGTLQAGGLLLLLTPEDWSAAIDPDYQRLAAWPFCAEHLTRHFVQRCERLLLEENVPQLSQQKQLSQQQGKMGDWTLPKPSYLPTAALGEEQAVLVAQLVSWFQSTSKSKRLAPVVITANRGRGKSSALGLFLRTLLLRELIQQPSTKKLLVTAPSTQATAAIFARFADLPAEQQAPVSFIAPDAVLQNLPPADLLIVDEAAAIPVPVLQALLAAYPACVFATTQQGYEGNGRGFALRFTQHLNQQAPNWLAFKLQQPWRWAAGDPLEALVNRLLLLDAEVVDPVLTKLPLSFSWLTQADLAANEALLQQVFGLLVLAHYRTTPDDFRQLLDAPNTHLACAWQGDLPVGLALIQHEGGFDTKLAQAIFMGKRRPQGHLLAQSLAFHGGLVTAARLNWWRVQRILVHPLLQRQGVGQQLLSFVLAKAQQQPALDLLGSSFGATADLLPFWFNAGYQPVRLGITKDQASGEHTLQVVQGISVAGKALQQQLIARFTETLPDVLSLWLKALSADLLVQILQALPLKNTPLSEQNQLELHAFANGHRPLAVSRTALKAWLWNALAQNMAAVHLTPWVALLLQEIFEQQLQEVLGLKGKKALDKWLRGQLYALLANTF